MMRKLLVFAFGCLLLGGVAARADSLYFFNGQLSTTSGDKAVTGQFTWNGTFIYPQVDAVDSASAQVLSFLGAGC